ncbi:unnamed protein product [Mytilus coruscus]|uniref:Novel STAND NTPase 3 domain-containing protein n=1 Tax=Mytilus coruscus TaxID=42192 RepID=A0A6J8BBX2_MYTCO|nr:unnamed protein product [Mytilus coruscus]
MLDITLARCLLVNFSLEVFWYGCVTRAGISLGDFLNTKKHTIYHLMKVNSPCCQCPTGYKFPVPSPIISEQQWKTLWDKTSASCVNHTSKQYEICSIKAKSGIDVSHLDSSLSGKLLENLCPTRKAVEDLVYIRNNVYGHASTGSLTDADYKIYMTKTEKALLQIATVCNKVNETTNKLKDVRQRPLDETLLVRYQTLLIEQKRTDEEIKEFINMTKTKLVERLDLLEMTQSGQMQEVLSAVKDVTIYPDEKEIRKKKLQTDAFASVKNHIQEGTFVEHAAVQVCMKRLEKKGRVVICGPPGTGKSRIAMELLHRYSTSHNEYSVMHIFNLTDWQEIMHENDKCIVLCDDIFGKSNFNYEEDLHGKCIDFINTCVESGDVRVIITMRGNILEKMSEETNLKTSHRLFRGEFINLGCNEFQLTKNKKRKLLLNYFNLNNIEVIEDQAKENFKELEVKNQDVTLLFHQSTLKEIIMSDTNPILGFPQACYLFSSNRKFTVQGPIFFKHANEVLLKEIRGFKKMGDINKNLDFTILVCVMLNGDTFNLYDIILTDIEKTFSVCQLGNSRPVTLSEVERCVNQLCGYFLKWQRDSYCFQHRTILEAVFLVFRSCTKLHADYDKILQLMGFDFIVEMTRSYEYQGVEGEVIYRVHSEHYELLAQQVIFHLTEKYFEDPYSCIKLLCESPIILLTCTSIIKQICKLYRDRQVSHLFKGNSYFSLSIPQSFNELFYTQYFNISVAFFMFCIESKDVLNYLRTEIESTLSSSDRHSAAHCAEAIKVAFLFLCRMLKVNKAEILWQIMKSNNIKLRELPRHFLFNFHVILHYEYVLKLVSEIVDDFRIFDVNEFLKCIILDNIEVENIKCLTKAFNADLFRISIAMVNACAIGSMELVNFLFDSFDQSLFDMELALNEACSIDNHNLVQYLFSVCDSKVFDVKTAMIIACGRGDTSLVKFLLETCGKSFLANHMALSAEQNELVDFLLDFVDDTLTSSDIWPQIFDERATRKIEMRKILFETYDHDLLDLKLIMTWSCGYGNIELMTFLSENFEHSNFNMKSALHKAISRNKVPIVSYMLEQFDLTISDLVTAMKIGFEKDDHEISEILSEKINHSSCQMKSFLTEECKNGNIRFVKYLIKNINNDFFDLKAAMNGACISGKIELVKFMLDTFGCKKFDMETAMNEVCGIKCGSNQVVRFLLNAYDNDMFNLKAAYKIAKRSGNNELANIISPEAESSTCSIN